MIIASRKKKGLFYGLVLFWCYDVVRVVWQIAADFPFEASGGGLVAIGIVVFVLFWFVLIPQRNLQFCMVGLVMAEVLFHAPRVLPHGGRWVVLGILPLAVAGIVNAYLFYRSDVILK